MYVYIYVCMYECKCMTLWLYVCTTVCMYVCMTYVYCYYQVIIKYKSVCMQWTPCIQFTYPGILAVARLLHTLCSWLWRSRPPQTRWPRSHTYMWTDWAVHLSAPHSTPSHYLIHTYITYIPYIHTY